MIAHYRFDGWYAGAAGTASRTPCDFAFSIGLDGYAASTSGLPEIRAALPLVQYSIMYILEMRLKKERRLKTTLGAAIDRS